MNDKDAVIALWDAREEEKALRLIEEWLCGADVVDVDIRYDDITVTVGDITLYATYDVDHYGEPAIRGGSYVWEFHTDDESHGDDYYCFEGEFDVAELEAVQEAVDDAARAAEENSREVAALRSDYYRSVL